MKLKYYLYISDLKLDMLFPQLSRWDKLKLRFSLRFKDYFLRLDLEGKKHKYSKLNQLSKHIQKKCDVGTIESPKTYVKDTVKMKWGIIPLDAGDMVLFFLKKENLIFVLGGTPEHLITENSLQIIEKQSRSDLFNIMLFFKSLEQNYSNQEIEGLLQISERDIPEAIEYISSNKQMVEQELEFLAKIYSDKRYNDDENIRIIIGSPIYVANA